MLYLAMATAGGCQFYVENRRQSNDGLYTDLMVWMPNMRVFRDMASSRLLECPYELNIISLAMPNFHIIKAVSSE